MKLKDPGKNISRISILNISEFGIWILVYGKEYFLPYKDFPWFKNARLTEIHNVRLHHGFHLYWPDLDVDLHLDSINNLEKYCLISS